MSRASIEAKLTTEGGPNADEEELLERKAAFKIVRAECDLAIAPSAMMSSTHLCGLCRGGGASADYTAEVGQ